MNETTLRRNFFSIEIFKTNTNVSKTKKLIRFYSPKEKRDISSNKSFELVYKSTNKTLLKHFTKTDNHIYFLFPKFLRMEKNHPRFPIPITFYFRFHCLIPENWKKTQSVRKVLSDILHNFLVLSDLCETEVLCKFVCL
jgi:hypothetical protein